jgi:tetratricopeptide (TPR) repeat protein
MMLIRKVFFTFILLGNVTTFYSQTKNDTLIIASITKLNECDTKQDFKTIAGDFERIIYIDEKNWLPYYYTAYSKVKLAYLSKGEDIDRYCDEAANYLKIAEKINPQNSEIYALYAYLYSVKVNVDPRIRGEVMGRKSADYINLSIKADPTNPRPYLIRAVGIYYTPKVFGGGEEKALPYLQKALEKFNTFVPRYEAMPSWGKIQAEQLLNNYKK